MNRLEQVKNFMLLNGQTIEKLPNAFIDNKIKLLRSGLLSEELEELDEAMSNNDIIEIADALVDLEYVLLGAVHAFGLGDLFEKLFTEVHLNNMSKMCNSLEEAQSTAEHFSSTQNISTYIEELDGKFAVKRTSDGKLMKSIMYQPVNLTTFFDGKNNHVTSFGH